MPTFAYKAKDGPGRTVEGALDADSRSEALASLNHMGYSPVWVREQEPEDERKARTSLWGRLRRITRRDVTLFTGQLASLTRSGVPILRTLRTIGEQTENPRMRKVVQEIEATIRDGSMLSETLARFPELFPELYVSMVRAGESGGVLDRILTRLSEAREEEEETRRKVQSAMAYPILIVVVGMVTVFVLLTFFLPKILELFESYEDLPTVTKILIRISGFFEHNWYWLVIGGLLAFAVLKRIATVEQGRMFFDRMKLKMPLVGRFVREVDIARFARTLSLMIDSGIAIDRALALAANTLRNSVLREEMERVRSLTITQGMPFSDGIKRMRHFPPLVANMAAVGEEGGKLDEALGEVAAFYEKSVVQQSRLATSLLEPALILVIGALVGFIVAAMLLPVFQMGTSWG